MALPSLADILLVVVLLVPGFVAFILFKKIGIREKQPSDFEATIWSLFVSLVIYAVFGFITGLSNIDVIRDNIFIPFNIALIFGLAILFGGSFGILARLLFRRGYQTGDCWEACIKSAARQGSYVLVYTADGKEYKGELWLGGVSEAPKEIVLRNPKVVLRDSNWNITDEFGTGSAIFFNENDIRRIVFLKDIV